MVGKPAQWHSNSGRWGALKLEAQRREADTNGHHIDPTGANLRHTSSPATPGAGGRAVSPGCDSCTVLEIIMTTALSDILKHLFYRCFTCTYVCVPCAHSTHNGQPWVGITSHRHRQFKTLTDAHSRPGPAKSLREEEQEAEQKRVDRLSGITSHWIHTHP